MATTKIEQMADEAAADARALAELDEVEALHTRIAEAGGADVGPAPEDWEEERWA